MSQASAFPTEPFGRLRGFDADAALGGVIKVLWQHDFEAMPLHVLNQAMGLSRSIFRACFGSKA